VDHTITVDGIAMGEGARSGSARPHTVMPARLAKSVETGNLSLSAADIRWMSVWALDPAKTGKIGYTLT